MEKARKRLGSKSNLCFVEARFHGTCRRHSTPLLLRLGNETIIAWCLQSIFGKCICSDQAAGHIAGAKFNTEMNRRENRENSSASLAIYPCNLDLQGHLNTCNFFHPHPTKTRSLHFRSNNLTGGHETRNLWQVWTLDLFCVATPVPHIGRTIMGLAPVSYTKWHTDQPKISEKLVKTPNFTSLNLTILTLPPGHRRSHLHGLWCLHLHLRSRSHEARGDQRLW